MVQEERNLFERGESMDKLNLLEGKGIIGRLEKSVCDVLRELMSGGRRGQIYSSACLVSVMNILHRNVKEGFHSTLRDIYYNNPSLYTKQSISDKYIAQVTHLVQTPRELLNVVSTARGRIRGPLIIQGSEFGCCEREVRLDCMSIFESMGHSISPYLFKGMNGLKFSYYSKIKFVLVVEKDTIFQRLLEFGFHKEFDDSCILITARGFSDLPTRTLLYKLSQDLPEETRFWILCDYDCFGLSIAATYVMGGKSDTWYDSSFSIPKLLPIRVPPISKLIESGLITTDNVFNMTKDEVSRIINTRNRLMGSKEISQKSKSEWNLICEQMQQDEKRFEIDCIVDIEKWLIRVIRSKLSE
ncbi:topoisomerase VIA nuclease subunit [Cryptosporidium sp. chipmunk genotype I]|uniref:topoisomerase VIA nuclease subunit n=1 Tax=Cryptosporidium sp. chipmunk genotype I TaxID=1280935 RepID=UPI003519F8AC|nr:topoisomerase VIA nuclease subunit [Cryptosporidium sp. chipmunk genotype I]